MEGSGGDAAAPSLGLMKGVMLCNRPVPPEAVAAQRALNSSAWRTGAVAEVVHPKGRDTVLDEVLMVRSGFHDTEEAISAFAWVVHSSTH